jgi:hypothetical protein
MQAENHRIGLERAGEGRAEEAYVHSCTSMYVVTCVCMK